MILDHDDDPSSCRQALLLAAKEGNARVVRLILTSGVDPNRLMFGRKTALGWARQNRHRDVATLLVRGRAR